MRAKLSDDLAVTVEDVFASSMRRKGHLVPVGSLKSVEERLVHKLPEDTQYIRHALRVAISLRPLI